MSDISKTVMVELCKLVMLTFPGWICGRSVTIGDPTLYVPAGIVMVISTATVLTMNHKRATA